MDKKGIAPCFLSANILLPSYGAMSDAWPVVACDQYVSQPEYWEEVNDLVGDKPSSLRVILPEAYLSERSERIPPMREAMENYLSSSILTEQVKQGFVLVERTTEAGVRIGLVGMVDLESYGIEADSKLPIRATEGIVPSRVPPRVDVRRQAPLEIPHIMLLIDDAKGRLIETVYAQRGHLRQLYDTALMKNGGHLRGYAVEGDAAETVCRTLMDMQNQSKGLFLAVGDGNHSLAAAKTYWEERKETLSAEEAMHHPARYALAEIVNLHCPALKFEPIHRVVFHMNAQKVLMAFEEYATSRGMALLPGADFYVVGKELETGFSISGLNGRLIVEIVQDFLSSYEEKNPQIAVDYIHGEKDALSLARKPECCGFLLKSIDKRDLFPAIEAGGVLPRKTFSMGEASEKRYYMECRKIAY